MPTLPLQHCAAPLCPELVGHGYCRIHSVQQEHARTNYALRRLYRTSRWRHPISGLRSIVLREEPICPECLADEFITATTDVHHLQKATAENFFERSNLQALCATHHSWHTQRGE